jgi:cytochrome c553
LPQERIRICGACHGEDGNSLTAGVPSIAGQPRTFLETQLVLFREGVRPSPQMQPAVAGLTDPEISAIAGVFAARPARAQADRADPPLLERGRAVALRLGCGGCHAADFSGRGQIPRLAAQREDYLVEAMTAFRDNRRAGGDTIMADALHGVPDADIRAMAHFFSRAR